MVIQIPGRRAFTLIVGATFAHGAAGADLHHHLGPSKGALVQMVTASSTASAGGLTFNPVNFGKVEPPAPIEPAGRKQVQNPRTDSLKT